MSVTVIGDRGVGKTTMVHELNESSNKERVTVQDGPDGTVGPTEELGVRTLKMVVDLPVIRQIQIQWVDTPGEAFTNRNWRNDHASAWEDIKQKMSQSRYLLLLLPPHQSLKLEDDYPTVEVWTRRVTEWLKFFNQECKKVKHILICLHKADLFCNNIEAEGNTWNYKKSNFAFHNYSEYVFNAYFKGVEEEIRQYQAQNRGQLISFFLTTIKNRALLELPWIYIGSYQPPGGS